MHTMNIYVCVCACVFKIFVYVYGCGYIVTCFQVFQAIICIQVIDDNNPL